MSYHIPAADRYENMPYNRVGKSGLMLPAISLGLWHNFGFVDSFSNARTIVLRAFDLGVTHFDLADNYGPPPGSAESVMGRILKNDLQKHRDELVISSKAGWAMWPGPYGDLGSRKHLMAGLDQSLQRLGLDYVDIFYHHRPDTQTPLEETMQALADMVRAGKALYVGISQYNAEQTRQAARLLKKSNTPFIIHQPKYNMFTRWIENGLADVLEKEGIGAIVFSPLAQGLLTNRYFDGIPADSRAAKAHGYLKKDDITGKRMTVIKKLAQVAAKRGQSLAQMAVLWTLRHPVVCSAIVGASKVGQLEEIIAGLKNPHFDETELLAIERILAEA